MSSIDPVVVALQAVKSHPDSPDAFNDLGIAYGRSGRIVEAEQALRQAVSLRPEHANGWHNLGNVLKMLKRIDEAERAYLVSVALAPNDAELHLSLGLFWRMCGRTMQAMAALANSVRLSPQCLDALIGLGGILSDLNRPAEALPYLEAAARLDPDRSQLQMDLGFAYRQLDRDNEAEQAFAAAVRLAPQASDSHANLASLFVEQGRFDEALRCARTATKLSGNSRLHVLSATMMPVICDSVEAIETARHRFDGETREMLDAGIRMDPTSYPVPNHFYLAYHGLDDRALMERAAALSDGPRANRIEYASPPARDRIRVGIASKLFKAHTIGQLNRGLISRINRKEFEIVVVMIGGLTDSISTEIARYADQVINVMPPVPAAMKALADAQFDILFYPEIGMDPLTYTLAHSRLAPVQAMTWGHPETSGLRTIDYFLSTNDLDPPGNDKYYTERLHRLPCLGTWYERPVPPTNARREEFGLPTSGILFGCPQSLFKFHPDFDSVLKRILEEVPGSYLVLLEGTKPHWRELLQARFQRTLGLLAERVVWVARCPRDAFLRLNACCDIMLDPLHFGGGNTTYEALSLGKPVVTWPSQFLRGRLSLAMYRQMGYLEMVTDSAEAFGTMAVRLARDAEFRNHASMAIREKSAVLFRDDEAVRGVEQFFREAAGRQV